MAATTGIGWTDGTVNFHIGCTKVGPGCDGCYAEVFANRKFNIKFGPGERRMRTLAGYENPLRWQRMHDRGQTTMRQRHADVPVPRWVFCNSLSDFFDNEIDQAWRADAWRVIRDTTALRWQIVTKRVGNVAKMLPEDWDGGHNYCHVGIIGTMVNEEEVSRDIGKLLALKLHGVRWVGLSIEPQLGPIILRQIPIGGGRTANAFTGEASNGGHAGGGLDWVICGGESKQGDHAARPFDLDWAVALMDECKAAGIPFFMKQFGDNPHQRGEPINGTGKANADPGKWSPWLRVQQMPTVFDADPAYEPKNLPAQKPVLADPGPTLL